MPIDDLLLARLARCRTVTIVLREGRAAFDHTTIVRAAAGAARQTQRVPAVPPFARVKLIRVDTAHRWLTVNVRTRQQETFVELLRRALDTLDARERHGMPPPRANDVRRRRLRKLLDRADMSRPPS